MQILSLCVYIYIFICTCIDRHTKDKCFHKGEIPHYEVFLNNRAFSVKHLPIFCAEFSHPVPIF